MQCVYLFWQNEDLTLLIKEMEQGRNDLEKVQDLYSETLVMDWWYNAEKDGDKWAWQSAHFPITEVLLGALLYLFTSFYSALWEFFKKIT